MVNRQSEHDLLLLQVWSDMLGFNCIQMSVSKNRGNTPKMDGENNGKPYEQMDDLGGFPIFLETPKLF